MTCPHCGEGLDGTPAECPFCASKLEVQSSNPEWRRAGEAPPDLPRGRMGAGGRTLLMLVPVVLFLIGAFWITSTSRARRAEMESEHNRAVRDMERRMTTPSSNCSFCGGKKTFACPACANGRSKGTCTYCGGTGLIPCTNCK